MKIYVRSAAPLWPDKIRVFISQKDANDRYLSADLADQLADVLKYHARRARGEQLPFYYHTLDADGKTEVPLS